MKARAPHLLALRRLNRARVDYLLIGVMGINHYATEPGAVYSTLDCDLLLRPTLPNLRRAVRALLSEGYRLESGGEPLGTPDAWLLERILRHRAAVTALKAGSLAIDIVLEGSGFSFSAWRRRRRIFRAGNIAIPCGDLDQLLLSKRLTGRRKDRAFLRLYRARLRDATLAKPRKAPPPKGPIP